MGIIYKITNNINGKIYIGQTIQDLKVRFRRHCSFSAISKAEEKMPIKKAIKKYGKENFSIIEIESADDSILNEREIFWIKHFNSFNDGYNATIGGCLNGKKRSIDANSEIEIINSYLDGLKPIELARKFNVDRKTIMNLLNRNRIKTRSITDVCGKDPISNELIIKLLSEGKSQRQIAKITNRCQGTIWKLIKSLENNTSKSVQILSNKIED